MKKQHIFSSLFFIAIIFCVCSLTSCSKRPINGDLDGRWQILTIEKKEVSENVKDSQLFYNFYLHVCNLAVYGSVVAEANLNYENNTISLNFPYVKSPEDMATLHKFGIFSNPVVFQVQHIDKKKLIIKEGDITITLRKF